MAPMSAQVGEERINTDLKRALESEEPEVQAVAVEGISKLMLTKVLRDAEVQSNMVFRSTYFHDYLPFHIRTDESSLFIDLADVDHPLL